MTYLWGSYWLEERKLTSLSPSITVEFFVQQSEKSSRRLLKFLYSLQKWAPQLMARFSVLFLSSENVFFSTNFCF